MVPNPIEEELINKKVIAEVTITDIFSNSTVGTERIHIKSVKNISIAVFNCKNTVIIKSISSKLCRCKVKNRSIIPINIEVDRR